MSRRRTTRRTMGWSLVGAVGALVALLGSGSGVAQELLADLPSPSTIAQSPPSSSAAHGQVPASSALEQLETLPVKGRAPMTGYEREKFGQSWSDDVTTSGGLNGCDGRNDVLRRDLTQVTIKPGTNGCVVLRGTLDDPYSGQVVPFVRGEGTSNDVPVDHVVSLGNGWATGAAQLTPEQRENFANDPLNLQPTEQGLNSQKSDADAATWLPPNKATRCTYVSRQIAVKARYDLWVTSPEKEAMTRVLSSCSAAQAEISPAAWDVPELGR